MTKSIGKIELASESTYDWLAKTKTRVTADDVPAFLLSMHLALANLAEGGASGDEQPTVKTYEPTITARKSVSSTDYIISMINGKEYQILRRHLSTNGMKSAGYWERYGPKAAYPMVAATYSAVRRAMAMKICLWSRVRSRGRRYRQRNWEACSSKR